MKFVIVLLIMQERIALFFVTQVNIYKILLVSQNVLLVMHLTQQINNAKNVLLYKVIFIIARLPLVNNVITDARLARLPMIFVHHVIKQEY